MRRLTAVNTLLYYMLHKKGNILKHNAHILHTYSYFNVNAWKVGVVCGEKIKFEHILHGGGGQYFK